MKNKKGMNYKIPLGGWPKRPNPGEICNMSKLRQGSGDQAWARFCSAFVWWIWGVQILPLGRWQPDVSRLTEGVFFQ